MVRGWLGRGRLQPCGGPVVIKRIGGSAALEAPVGAEDPGAGEGDSYGQAVQAIARALSLPAEKTGALKEGLRAAVFALYRQYEDDTMPMPMPNEETDPGY